MKYIYALLISLFLPTVVFAQSVPVSWLRNTASGFLTPLNINDSVGIGTSTPYSKLSIQYGTILANTLSPILTLGGTHAAASGGTSIDFTVNGNTNSMSRIGSVISGTSGELALYTTTQYSTVSPTEKLRITGSGNVGIGTTTPAARLDVAGTIAQDSPIARFSFGGTWNDEMRIVPGGANGTNPSLRLYRTTGVGLNYNPYEMKLAAGGSLQFNTGSSAAKGSESYTTNTMTLSAAGNVGIGTTTPWTRLAVTGSTTIAGGPLIVLGSANTPISADTDWYRQFGLFRKDINDYSFMTLENRNGGSNASVDFLFNNDRTTALSYYWDLGFNSSAFNNPAFGLLNVPNAAYEYVTDGPKISATATTSSAGYFDFITGGLSSSRLRITSTGNIGIGTTSPQGTLTLHSGQLTIPIGTSGAPGLAFNNDLNTGIYSPSAESMAFTMNGTDRWMMNSSTLYGTSGGTEITGSFRISRDPGTVSLPTYSFGADSNLGMYRYGADTLSLVTGGLDRMIINSSGLIGIGTTTPQSTLSVGSVNDATNSYAQIDSVNGAPTAGDCDTDLERGRMIIDYSNNRFYICNGATRGWDYSALTD